MIEQSLKTSLISDISSSQKLPEAQARIIFDVLAEQVERQIQRKGYADTVVDLAQDWRLTHKLTDKVKLMIAAATIIS